MFPWSPFAGVWDRVVGHLLPVGHEAVQVVIEPDLVHCPAAMLRAVAAGAGIAPAIVGVVERVGVAGIEIRPLYPEPSLDLEVVWRVPASPALGRLVEFLVDVAAHPSGALQPGWAVLPMDGSTWARCHEPWRAADGRTVTVLP
jgi:DNA-binding transcriptional LysR family regulator